MKMLQQAYGEYCMSLMQCYGRFNRFKEDRTPIDEDSRSGRPTTLTNDNNIDAVRAIIRGYHRLIV